MNSLKLRLEQLAVLIGMFMLTTVSHAIAPEAYTWQDVHSVDFGSGANHFSIKAASAGLGGEVQLRLDAADGPVIGYAFFHHTGGANHYIDYECNLNQTITGSHDVYMNFLDYIDPVENKPLNVDEFEFTFVDNDPVSAGDRLNVYPPVDGLDQSPYYRFYIQKQSDLNAANLEDVTNWETPFAWFTKCVTDGNNEATKTTAYFSQYIGDWSQTYCNFELDKNTPIVVKIVRLNKAGAPSGPISAAAAHPSRKVNSCEIINGDVYVTMEDPAQVCIDIDGQLDSRDAPRNLGFPIWSGNYAPYGNEADGVHLVSIFANPVIEDKPDPDAADVKKVFPGDPVPEDDGSWSTLYFMPGIHKMSVDAQGNEREWRPGDIIDLNSNRNYYIPGDAIVYGNFNSMGSWSSSIENVRVYGHGTVSGSKMVHFKDFSPALESIVDGDNSVLRTFEVHGASNVIFEGITSADPAEHGLYIYSGDNNPVNYIKWAKIISWRVNNDGTVASGNSYIEDCFIRHQDDANYIEGAGFRRCVLVSDVNGAPLRGSWIADRRSGSYPSNLPTVLNYDNIDVIYPRGGMFGRGKIIGGGSKVSKTYSDGVFNTGQHLLYSNIDVEDPNPVRVLFGFDTDEDKSKALKGIRFQNLNYRSSPAFNDDGNPNTFIANQFKGNANDDLQYFVFDNVLISGQQVDLNLLNDPDYFDTEHVSDFTFRLRDTISPSGNVLTTTVTNGVITVEETGNPGEVTLTASATNGFEFNGWRGDLSGNENPITITVDRDMAITASVDIYKYDLNTISENGTIVLDPPSGSYLSGTVVTVTTIGDLGYGFESWGGDLSGTSTTETITMDGDKTISANFTQIVTYELDIDTKYGSVVLDPPGGTYNNGTEVSLTTNPDLGYIFGEWSGDLSGSQSSKTITMDADKTVSAKFLYAGAGGSSDVALNCGGSQYITADNVVYEPSSLGAKYATNESISGTDDVELYQSESFGGSLSYNFPLNNGPYEVILKFAEIFHGQAGKRVFDVSIEDEVVLDDFDIVAEAGGKNIALDKSFIVTVLDQELNITLSKVLDNAKISAIQIISQSVEVESFTLEVSDPQNGSITIDPVEDTYPAGSEVTLAAVAETGFAFVGWSGDYNGFDNPTDLYMDGNKRVTALFDEAQTYTLTSHITNGEISLSPEGGIYNQLTEVVVSVSPEEGYKFAGWQGDLSGTDNPATIVMNGDKDITALIVEIPTYTLSTQGDNGNVSIDPVKETYLEGDQVTITATANEGYRFEAWSGDYAGSLNPATITIDENKSITAVFEEIPTYTLTTIANNGSITLDPAGGIYEEGTSVSISLSVDEGYRLVGWSGNLSGTQNPVTLVMNGDKEITAQIEEIPSYTLTIAGENGAVSIDPQKDEYEEGEQVTITASADEGYRFGAWSGDLTGSQNPATIIMNGDKSITAQFNMIPVYTLTTTAPNGTITLDPEGGSYQEGTSVTITLSVDEGYEFVGWLGDLTGNDNPVSIVMNENKTITAAIVEIPSYTLVLSGENGSVSVDPQKESYLEDEQVTITATADEGYKFTGWSGALTGTENPATVVMDGNKLITAVFEIKSGAEDILANAKQSRLLQNYPNPFSDKTTIEYHLSSPEHVKISVYNMTGQEVVVLVDREKRSGKHEVIWDAQQSYGKAVPQGLYICRFEAGGLVQTTKVILAK